jgi:hypothetical protein
MGSTGAQSPHPLIWSYKERLGRAQTKALTLAMSPRAVQREDKEKENLK